MSYIRFVVGTESEAPSKLVGLLTEVEHLRKGGLLEDYQSKMALEIFDYYNENLPCPPFSDKNWSPKAVSWFQDSATQFIHRMWDLAFILEQNDMIVRILKTEKPGMILYQDKFQVVAQERIH